MNNKSDNHPFYPWVPRPLGILILLLMFVPPTFSGGAYLCNIGEMSGSLGMLTEDIQLASFFTSIGMCLFPPFMVRFLQTRRAKHTYLWCFLVLAVLNGICAITTELPVLLTCCMLIGFTRIIVMLNCTFTIAPYLTGMDTLAMFTMTQQPSPEIQYQLERKRTFLMPVLYFFILLISQLSNVLTAWFAYEYHWQDAYFVVIGMLMAAMMLVVVTMPDEKRKGYKMEWRKVPGMILMAAALCCFTYILVYGKTLDWFASDSICWAFILMLLSCGALLMNVSRAGLGGYLPLSVFSYRNVAMSMGLFLLCMIFNSANNFVSAFSKLSTPINNVQSASLSLWACVGCFIGLLLSIWLIAKKVRFKTIFCIAFLLMAASNAYVYFQYQTIGLFDNMMLPMILNFAGLLMLYSIVAAWGMKGLPSHHLATFVFLMIWMRNAIAPVAGASIYSSMLYHRQQYYIARLAQNVDSENLMAASTFTQTKHTAQASGKSGIEADQLAATSIKARIAKQATLVAMKDITGNTVLLLTSAAILVLFLPYRKGETT